MSGSRCILSVLLVSAAAAPVRAATIAQQQIGSFVSGERSMYLEISPLVEGGDFMIELRNVPRSAANPRLICSASLAPIDLTPWGIPGALGPALGTLLVLPLDPVTHSIAGTVPAGITGVTIYLQAFVEVQGGGRLSSMVTAHVIAPGDDPGNDPTIVFPLPLTTQEVLPPGVPGVDRSRQPVRVGVPLPVGTVAAIGGIPQLALLGGGAEAQFSTLATWPDGSVKWALCEYLADLPAGTISTAWSVDHGSGNSGGADLAARSGSVTTIDTGAIRLELDEGTPALLDSFQRGGREVLDVTRGNRPHFFDDLDVEWTWHETAVTIRRNGPVRAEVEVDGAFTRSSAPDDPDRIYVRFYLEAHRGGSSVRATVSLRNTSVEFPEHLFFRGFTWRAWLNETGRMDVRMPQTSSNGATRGLWSASLYAAADDAVFHQGFARNTKFALSADPNWSNYYPFIERFGTDRFAVEGVHARIGSTYFTGSSSTQWRSAEHEYADPAFLELNAESGRGAIFGVEHVNVTWPVALEAGGDGRVEVALFPRLDPADAYPYRLTYATAETRCFWLLAEDGPDDAPIDEAARFDYPVAARADLHTYNQSDVWHWRLVDSAQLDAYVAHAGLRDPQPPATEKVRTIYEYSNATGGGSNNWQETRRFFQWIRSGRGGAYLNSWLEAIYKADKMPWAIDDDVLKNRKGVRNSSAPVTKKDDFYNNSKHTFLQVVPDWAFARGETYLLDSARSFAETLLDNTISDDVQPGGNFVPGTFGAIVNAAAAILDLRPDAALESWLHEICYQWANIVFKVDNGFGVNTSTRGWQAPIGTPPGSANNPDAYMITWDAGKSSDKAKYGYLSQAWTDVRLGSLGFWRYAHHLREVDPADPLIGDLIGRGPDWYHYVRRSTPDDHQSQTGDAFQIDVFAGDAGNSNVDPFADPGPDIDFPDPSGYAMQSAVNLLLEGGMSESALSYGVEMNRGMSRSTYDQFVNDPVLNEFIWRYLVHYGLLKP